MESFFKDLRLATKKFNIQWESLPHIRGKYNNQLCCPITAVCLLKTNKLPLLYKMYDKEVLATIGLDYEEARKIVQGADHREPRYLGRLTDILNID